MLGSFFLRGPSTVCLIRLLDIFLQMNDQINSVLNRYEAFKKGDYTTARNPIPEELAKYDHFACGLFFLK